MERLERRPPTGFDHVVTVGDSTLDNLIWMEKDGGGAFRKRDCVVGALRRVLGKTRDSLVTNLAADGFTSANVLDGAPPMLSAAAWARVGEPFPVCDGAAGILRPLDALSDLHAENARGQGARGANHAPVTHVILSVGGNDVREILRDMHALPQVVARFHSNYARICERILALQPVVKLVLVLQYQVCLKHEHGGYGVYNAMSSLPGPGTGPQKLQAVMERIYGPVLQLAQRHKLAVIDLPRTFDPADAELYRLQIEPSAKGSELIAAVVAHALATHDFDGPSRLYSRSPSGDRAFRSEANAFDASRPWTVVRAGDEAAGGAVGADALAPAAEVSAQLAARGAHVQALPHAVRGLMEMGFPEDRVKAALSQCGNLPQQALELLLAP